MVQETGLCPQEPAYEHVNLPRTETLLSVKGRTGRQALWSCVIVTKVSASISRVV